MILKFIGSLLQVKAATPAEMDIIRKSVSDSVSRFHRTSNWDGVVTYCWYIPNDMLSAEQKVAMSIDPNLPGYFYLPAACWKRLIALREPDPKIYRPAYDVQFEDQDKFFNKQLQVEEVEAFVNSLQPPFPDVNDQIALLHAIIFYRFSSHNVSTGFGKTYCAFLLAQYTKQVFNGKTLMIVPRNDLVIQGINDVISNDPNKPIFQAHLDEEVQLKVYGICGGVRNYCTFDEADLVIGTYQSLVNMPDDMFLSFHTVICDEGHGAKALSVKDTVCRCKNAEYITAISGTIRYVGGADALTIEAHCGPMILDYPAHQQIAKGRLPKIAIQPIRLKHYKGAEHYHAILQTQRLPMPAGNVTLENAGKYRWCEWEFLMHSEALLDYIIKLASAHTDQGHNVLIIFQNVQPVISLFEYAVSVGCKAHMIHGGTHRDVRRGIRNQIENEKGWMLFATAGTMSMGISINNLQAYILCMIGKSANIVLQGIGRMLRNHPDKEEYTMCYDIINDIKQIGGTEFDIKNSKGRAWLYEQEKHPVKKTITRNV